MFSSSRFLPKGSDEFVSLYHMVAGLVPPMLRYKYCTFLTWWEVWFLPWSDISAEPFQHGGRMGLPWLDVSAKPFRHGGKLVLPWSDVSVGPFRHGGRLGLPWSDVSADPS